MASYTHASVAALPALCGHPCPAREGFDADSCHCLVLPCPADLNFLYLSSRFLEFISPDLARTSLSGAPGKGRQAAWAGSEEQLGGRAMSWLRHSWLKTRQGSRADWALELLCTHALGPSILAFCSDCGRHPQLDA